MANKLKVARLIAGLSRQEVENATGIHKNTLARYESYDSNVPISRAVKLCNLYGCELDDIEWEQD